MDRWQGKSEGPEEERSWDTTQLNVRIPADLARRLKVFAVINRMRMADLVAQAVEAFLGHEGERPQQPPAEPSQRPKRKIDL